MSEQKDMIFENEKDLFNFLSILEKDNLLFKEESIVFREQQEEHHRLFLKQVDERFDRMEKIIQDNTKEQNRLFGIISEKIDNQFRLFKKKKIDKE